MDDTSISIYDEDTEDARKENKRKFQFMSVVKEIVQTERNYVSDLETIVEVFQNPLQSNKLISSKELQIIFCNIHDVLRINKVLLSEIKMQLPDIDKETSFETMQMYCIQLCNIFLKYGDMLKVYAFYCNNKTSQLQALMEAQRKSKPFAEFLYKQTKTEPRCRHHSLETFLSIPFQRICKYPLLFKELAKNTLPVESQYCCLEQLCTKLNNIVNQVNNNKRIAENIDKMVSLRYSIDQLPSDFELLVPARRFIREGDILLFSDNAYKTRHMFLFNDMLMIAKKARLGVMFHYVAHIMSQDHVTISDEKKYGIRIEYKEKDTKYSILTSSSAEQQEWLHIIQETLHFPTSSAKRATLHVPPARPLPPPPTSRDSVREHLSRSFLQPPTPEPEKQPSKRSSYTSYGAPTGFSYLASTNDAATPHKPLTHAKTNVRLHQTQQIISACLDDLLQMFTQAYKAYKSNAPVKHNTSAIENILTSNVSKLKVLNAEDSSGEDYQAKVETLDKIESAVGQLVVLVRGLLDELASKRSPSESEVRLQSKLQSQRKKIGDLMGILNK